MIEVTQGEDINFTLRLKDVKTGRPFDLTGYDQFKVCVEADSGTVPVTATEVDDNGTIVAINANVLLGELDVTYSNASGDSDNIKLNEELDVCLEISKSTDSPSKPLRKVFSRALFVVPFKC